MLLDGWRWHDWKAVHSNQGCLFQKYRAEIENRALIVPKPTGEKPGDQTLEQGRRVGR